MTGFEAFGQDAMHGVDDDLVRMDSISFPLAFAVMASVLRSLRLLIVPFCCILCSAAGSLGVLMYPISMNTDVISFAPSVMMSLTIAVSIDYSLFILSRYREEIVDGRSTELAVLATLCTAGHTVLISGSTLFVAFLGLMFFPTTLLSSVGVGAACSVFMAVACNLTLAPAMILTFPKFFGNVATTCICCAAKFCPADELVLAKNEANLAAELERSW